MLPMRDGQTNDERTREDRATQPMDAGWLSFANTVSLSEFDIYILLLTEKISWHFVLFTFGLSDICNDATTLIPTNFAQHISSKMR